jgi:hypothetical protein
MSFSATRFVMVVGIAAAASLCSAMAEPLDNSTRSMGFWSEFKAVNNSNDFITLKKAVGSTDKVKAAIVEGQKIRSQSIANMAVDRPVDVAQLLTSISASSSGTANQTAVATVLAMRTTAKAREAAAPLIAPSAKAQVATMTANLSTGIAGLPGIYLGDNAQANSGGRSATPTGYPLVAGGSMGCPMR